MQVITEIQFKHDLEQAFLKATENNGPLVITRNDGDPLVVIPLNVFNAMSDTCASAYKIDCLFSAVEPMEQLLIKEKFIMGKKLKVLEQTSEGNLSITYDYGDANAA